MTVVVDKAVHAWPGVFASALRGVDCVVHGLAPRPVSLPVGAWRRSVSSDLAVLRHCVEPTLDIGCGPGRLTAELARLGLHALGIDVVDEAVRQTRARGVPALQRDVFGPLPGEGRWACALLADGNIGIGGDPVRLLRRVGSLLAADGRVVVDLAAPGAGLRCATVHLETHGARSESFPWAVVGPEAVRDVATSAGLAVGGLHEHDGRWFAVLVKGGAS